MSLTFAEIKGKLLGQLDILPPAMLGDIVNDALLDIYNSNEWGFLVKKDVLRTPALINVGTASVTKYSELVTLNSVASAAIVSLNENDVPLIERQFRNASVSANTGNPFSYNIIDFDTTDENAVVLTLDQPYWDETNAAANYQILKIFYNPPYITNSREDQVIDFKYWKYFISLKLQRRLHTDTTLDQLNKFDPSRYYIDDPRHVVAHPPSNDDDFPKFELYPAPKFERIYQVIYQRRGLSLLKETDIIPSTLDAKLVLKRAEYEAYKWMFANLHKYPEMKGSAGRYQNLMALCMNPNDKLGYLQLLDRAIKKDEENYPKAYFGDYARMSWIDSFIGNFPYLNEFDGGANYPSFSIALLNF
jgi:hypothetical protein